MKCMKRFIALFLSFTMLSTSVAFAGESAKSHFSAFNDVPTEAVQQSDLDEVSGKFSLGQLVAVVLVTGTIVYVAYTKVLVPGLKYNNQKIKAINSIK